MRAATLTGNGIEVRSFDALVPADGQVLVKTLACGICGSDLHAAKHIVEFAAAGPDLLGTQIEVGRDLVMGHEFCVEVLEYGPGCTAALPVGSRACSVPMTVTAGQVHSVGYSHEYPGGYGEHMLRSEAMLLEVPNGLSTEIAALTEPMAVGWHAVEMARLTAEDVPLVIGCGPVGLSVIAALAKRDVRPIVAADYSPARRRFAEAMGADIVIDPAVQSPYASWQGAARASAQGERAPVNPLSGERQLPPGVYFECVGVPGVIDQMLVGAERGCRFVIVGVCMEQDVIQPMQAIGIEANLQFVLGYTPDEFATTLSLLAEGELKPDLLVTGKVGLSGVANAFDTLASPEEHAKILVEPWRE